jgi:hypothetical protein
VAPITINLRTRVAEADIRARSGMHVTTDDVKLLLTGDCNVYRPDGAPLCALRTKAIPEHIDAQARPALKLLRKYTSDNRGKYAGGRRVRNIKRDGTVSRTTRVAGDDGKLLQVPSSIVGYFDRSIRHPFCRPSAFVTKEPEAWGNILPLAQHVSACMRQDFTARWSLQLGRAQHTDPAYVIPHTPFTTLTVNNTVIGTIHQDAGDFKDGIGALTYHREGTYRGGWLVFPQYQVGIECGDRDLVYFNPHDWHAVMPMWDASPDAERISVVYYYRTKMTECLPPLQELQRCKDSGLVINDDGGDDGEET